MIFIKLGENTVSLNIDCSQYIEHKIVPILFREVLIATLISSFLKPTFCDNVTVKLL